MERRSSSPDTGTSFGKSEARESRWSRCIRCNPCVRHGDVRCAMRIAGGESDRECRVRCTWISNLHRLRFPFPPRVCLLSPSLEARSVGDSDRFLMSKLGRFSGRECIFPRSGCSRDRQLVADASVNFPGRRAREGGRRRRHFGTTLPRFRRGAVRANQDCLRRGGAAGLISGLMRAASIDIESGWLAYPAQLSEPLFQLRAVNFSSLVLSGVLDGDGGRHRE